MRHKSNVTEKPGGFGDRWHITAATRRAYGTWPVEGHLPSLKRQG
jgi:hypothetical protein